MYKAGRDPESQTWQQTAAQGNTSSVCGFSRKTIGLLLLAAAALAIALGVGLGVGLPRGSDSPSPSPPSSPTLPPLNTTTPTPSGGPTAAPGVPAPSANDFDTPDRAMLPFRCRARCELWQRRQCSLSTSCCDHHGSTSAATNSRQLTCAHACIRCKRHGGGWPAMHDGYGLLHHGNSSRQQYMFRLL